MKRAIAYFLLGLAWLALAFFLSLLVGLPIAIILSPSENLILWRVVLGVLIAVGVALLSVFVIRWGRSVLGKPGGSRAGRIVLGIVVIVWGIGTYTSPDADTTAGVRDFSHVGGAVMALFGAALIVEAVWGWRRASKAAAAPLPDAPTATADSPAVPEIVLPEPPHGP